jgi:hypothetical protein
MPPVNFFFPELPAEINDAPVTQVRKVAEALVDIFDEDAQFVDGLEVVTDLLETADVVGSQRGASTPVRLGRGSTNLVTRLEQDGLALLDVREVGLQLGNELVGFKEREDAFRRVVILVACHEPLLLVCVTYFFSVVQPG